LKIFSVLEFVIALSKSIAWFIPLAGLADELQPGAHVRRLSGAAAAL
jgi:hypothetical protein